MRNTFFILLALLLGSCAPIEISDYKGESDLSVMSFNLRYDEPADGSNKWSNRKEACITMLKELSPAIFGIQEGLHHQVSYLNEQLPIYNYVGVGRDNGEESGEYAAIFYSSSQFELEAHGNFWLSETPDTPSKGWDANNIRIATWCKLLDVESNKSIYVFNTHLDHKGKTAQKKGSQLIVDKIAAITQDDTEVPIILTGDFNMLIGNDRLSAITKRYRSAQRFANKSDKNKSYNAFGLWVIARNIDFIFYDHIQAVSYKTIVKDYGVDYISDHYPILTHFKYQ